MFFTDQIGHRFELEKAPQRIVSLVPSQTELLWDLGLQNQLIGRTKFCVHPKEELSEIFIVGGTKNFHLDRIKALKPDLIIANKEENEETRIKALQEEFPIWTSDIKNLPEALEMIQSIGDLCDRNQQAKSLTIRVEQSFAALPKYKPKRAAYIIWKDPLMSVGHDCFIHDMMQRAGLINVFSELKRYPQISIEKLQEIQPDLLLLSSEPFPFKDKHIQEFEAQLPNTKTVLVDGEMFSWYGSRLLYFANYVLKWRDSLS